MLSDFLVHIFTSVLLFLECRDIVLGCIQGITKYRINLSLRDFGFCILAITLAVKLGTFMQIHQSLFSAIKITEAVLHIVNIEIRRKVFSFLLYYSLHKRSNRDRSLSCRNDTKKLSFHSKSNPNLPHIPIGI